MRRLTKDTHGQFVIIAALLISILTLALAASIHEINIHRQQMSYKPIQELVLGISSDFERALNHAANIASHTYDTSYNSSPARAAGSSFLANWTRSVLTAYANAGLKVAIIDQSEDFAFNWQWNDSSPGRDFGSTFATAQFSLDAETYGFEGWIGHSQKTILLTLYPETIDASSLSSTTLKFSLTQTTGQGENTPISNLAAESLMIQRHINGPVWASTNITALTYLGGGNYSVTLAPRINRNTLGVILTVSTPDEGILVKAKNYQPFVTTTLQSQQTDYLSANLGSIQFGDSTYAPLPVSVSSQVGTYIIQYLPESGYTFVNWTTTANATISDPTSPLPQLVTVTGDNNITAFYRPTPVTANVGLDSVELNNLSSHLGSITFDSIPYSPLPKEVKNISVSNYHPVQYSPVADMYFQFWQTQGNVIVSNGTASSTTLFVQDNGNLTAVYASTVYGGATVGLSSEAWDGSSKYLGNITFGSAIYSLPYTLNGVQWQDYALQYSLYNSTYVFINWTVEGNVLPWNSTNPSTTVTVAGDGNITAIYGPAPFPGSGGPLYLNVIPPHTPVLVLDEPPGGHVPITSNTPHVVAYITSQSPTTSIYVASAITVYAYLQPHPKASVKDVTLELGFTFPASNGQYYLLGTGNFTVNSQDLYILTINVQNGNWTKQYGVGIIPANSMINLTIGVDFIPPNNGFFDMYYGYGQNNHYGPTRIEFS